MSLKFSFTQKSLKFQIMSVTAVLLLIPILVMLYDIFFASKSDEAMILDRKDRLGNIVQTQLVPGITGLLDAKLGEADSVNSISQDTLNNYLQEAFNKTAEPLVPNYPGIRYGLYIPHNEQIFVQGFLHQYRKLSRGEETEREKRILDEADSGLEAVVASRKPLARLTSSLNDETFEYLAPIIIDNQLVAVAWADERLHPIFAQSRSFRMFNRYIILFGFFLGGIGALVIIHNLTDGISRLKKGLAEMEKDIAKLLPEMPGEPGQVAQAINKMAIGLAEKEKLEEELRRSERLAALGRLVTGVAHELRNPIGVVKATVQVMEAELNGNTEITEYTAVIKEHVDRQNRVIQELLDFGRPCKPLIQPVSANSLLSKVLTFTGPMLRQHKINLQLRLANDIPMVSADGEKIKQVFVNLMLNAIQAMPEGGDFTLTTYSNDEYVCIEFSDNGEGIQSGNITSVFDPFYTTKETGSGLGLSISHQIVKSHGGTIEVKSEEGMGTTFTVKLLITGARRDVTNDTQDTYY
jgi:signal transduction histidine kinase